MTEPKQYGGCVMFDKEGGRVERLLLGIPDSLHYAQLCQWREQSIRAGTLHDFVPDYHRLQLEHWIWSQFQPLPSTSRVLDVGTYDRRGWIGSGYATFGRASDNTHPDIEGDLCTLTVSCGGPWDVIICTEVLEHCVDPRVAVQQIAQCLAPHGRLLASSPFLWPDHATENYPDYWRFTQAGWRLLCAPHFTTVTVHATSWTSTGRNAWDIVRQSEGMGFDAHVTSVTGYCIEARK